MYVNIIAVYVFLWMNVFSEMYMLNIFYLSLNIIFPLTNFCHAPPATQEIRMLDTLYIVCIVRISSVFYVCTPNFFVIVTLMSA